MNERYHVGKVDHVSARKAYIISEELEEDVEVYAPQLGGAWHGDKVKIQILKPTRTRWHGKRSRMKGQVLSILERRKSVFTGRFILSGKSHGFVEITDRKIHEDVFVPYSGFGGARDGDKVQVRIDKWSTKSIRERPQGKITRVLGKVGQHEAEMEAILIDYEVDNPFSKEVLKESETISEEIREHEIAARRDMRKILTFTVDPENAKDFDDALSYRKIKDGKIEIGIHIADVTHYVKPGTAIEEEAQRRANSIYLVDRTLPMLPEKLSNQVCSLMPNKDRLSFSIIFEVSKEGRILSEWIGKTIIHSQKRLSYEEAQEYIDGKEGSVREAIQGVWKIASIWQQSRFEEGAIAFELPEVAFEMGPNYKPLRILRKDRKEAHFMIEECMLMANKRIAESAFQAQQKKQIPTFVYRNHGKPDMEKIEILKKYANKFGHQFKEHTPLHKAFNSLLREIENHPEASILNTLAVRSMDKATYSPRSIGHFGLGFSHYTHFTSPIRRYPDMMVHRLIQKLISQKTISQEEISLVNTSCIHCSEKEKLATEIERTSVKYKQVEWMKEHIGEEFKAMVSGIKEWGVFVEITSLLCEGMVPLSSLKDDNYLYDPKEITLEGQRTKRRFSLGDVKRVKVVQADLSQRIVEFEFADQPAKPQTEKRNSIKKKRYTKFHSKGRRKKRRT
ncbi:MAG: ribonuclease R [Cytophagales bacterium]|nr:ribonuclease R [Cytophagales bacterium]